MGFAFANHGKTSFCHAILHILATDPAPQVRRKPILGSAGAASGEKCLQRSLGLRIGLADGLQRRELHDHAGLESIEIEVRIELP